MSWRTNIFQWAEIEGRSDRRKIRQAIKWVAAEHGYLRAVSRDLEQLTNNIKKATVTTSASNAYQRKSWESDVRRLLRDFYYVGKCERRAEQKEKDVEDVLAKLRKKVEASGTLHELDRLARHIHLAAETVVRNCSLREGMIANKLRLIESGLEHYQKDHSISSVLTELRVTAALITETQQWISALESNLERAMRLDEGLRARSIMLGRDAGRATGRLNA